MFRPDWFREKLQVPTPRRPPFSSFPFSASFLPPPLPTTCGFYSPLAQRINVSSRWTLKPKADRWFPRRRRRRNGNGLRKCERRHVYGGSATFGQPTIVRTNPLLTCSFIRSLLHTCFVSRCAKAHEVARRTIAPVAVRLEILCPTDENTVATR